MPPKGEVCRLDSDAAHDPACISIIVITLNEEKNVRDLLDSMLHLDYPSDCYEVVVVDASSDSTPSIVREYPSVRLILTDEIGFATQKNLGLAQTSHPIVACTDADCTIPSDWLHVIDVAMRNEKLAGIGGNAYAPPRATFIELCYASVGHPAGGAVGLDGNVTPTQDGIEFIGGCNSVYRRSVLEDVGGFDTAFDGGGEDVDISRRLKSAGHFIDYVPELTVYHMPRTSIAEYWRWNLRVGSTKYNLHKPSLLRLIFEPSFSLWSVVIMGVLLWLVFMKPLTLLPVALLGWVAYLVFLYVGAKPYPLLLKRRRRIGLPLWACLTIVPFLIYIRQLAINIGEFRERRIIRGH